MKILYKNVEREVVSIYTIPLSIETIIEVIKQTNMKVPHFENCQVILEPNGSIMEASEEFCDWMGQSLSKISGHQFRNLMISMEQEWEYFNHYTL